jgi:hypothetical protein
LDADRHNRSIDISRLPGVFKPKRGVAIASLAMLSFLDAAGAKRPVQRLLAFTASELRCVAQPPGTRASIREALIEPTWPYPMVVTRCVRGGEKQPARH